MVVHILYDPFFPLAFFRFGAHVPMCLGNSWLMLLVLEWVFITSPFAFKSDPIWTINYIVTPSVLSEVWHLWMGQALVKGKAHGLRGGRRGTTVRLRPSNSTLSEDKVDRLLNAPKPQFHHLLGKRIIIIITTIAPVPRITMKMQGDKLCRAQHTQWALAMVALSAVLLSLCLPLPSSCLPPPPSSSLRFL